MCPFVSQNIPGVVSALANMLCVSIPRNYEVIRSPGQEHRSSIDMFSELRVPPQTALFHQQPGMRLLRPPGAPLSHQTLIEGKYMWNKTSTHFTHINRLLGANKCSYWFCLSISHGCILQKLKVLNVFLKWFSDRHPIVRYYLLSLLAVFKIMYYVFICIFKSEHKTNIFFFFFFFNVVDLKCSIYLVSNTFSLLWFQIHFHILMTEVNYKCNWFA